jgi:arylsulfatase A-like enzyme
VGCNGNADVKTPNLDALAREGVTFERFYAQNPVCMPSRISFFTGQYPSALGIERNGVSVPQDAPTLPRLLKPAGYHCANIGKMHFVPHANRDWREPYPDYGFDHAEISDEPGCYEDAYRAWLRQRAPEAIAAIDPGLPPAAEAYRKELGLNWDTDGVKRAVARPPYGAQEQTFPPTPFPADEGLTHVAFVADRTIAYLRRRRAQPFFCVASVHAPHPPWRVPQRFIDLYDPAALAVPAFPAELEAQRAGRNCSDAEIRNARHGHYAFMSEIDYHVGRVLEALAQSGLSANTVVIFMSDHGVFLGEHLTYSIGHPYERCLRVPFIMRCPNGVAGTGARVVTEIVEAVDVAPTLLECAGLQIPYHIQGRSFLSSLRGQAQAGRDTALSEMEGWKSLRTARYRYTVYRDGAEELYDSESDVDEYCNLSGAPAHCGSLAEMRKAMLDRLLTKERPRRAEWSY